MKNHEMYKSIEIKNDQTIYEICKNIINPNQTNYMGCFRIQNEFLTALNSHVAIIHKYSELGNGFYKPISVTKHKVTVRQDWKTKFPDIQSIAGANFRYSMTMHPDAVYIAATTTIVLDPKYCSIAVNLGLNNIAFIDNKNPVRFSASDTDLYIMPMTFVPPVIIDHKKD